MKMEWNEYISNDPYERYREAPGGCRDILIAIMCVFLFFVVILFTSCKSQQHMTPRKDSVRVEFKHDSVFIWQHDSVFRDRWRNGDTVFVNVEKWQTRWRDRTIEIHDTITTNDVQVVTEKYIPAYYKNTSSGFWVLVAIFLLLLGVRVARFIIKIKTGGIL